MMNRKRRLCFEPLDARRLLAAVDIPDDLTGAPLGQVTAPVNIEDAAGLRAAEIRLEYDANVLEIDADDIVAGTVWGDDDTVDIVASVDASTGTIVIAVFAAEGIPDVDGSLVELQFTIRAGVAAGTTTDLDLTFVRLNEGSITVDVMPQPGADATDGRITVIADSGDASISGFVYADTNNNNQVDAGEAIPGVRITLRNTDTGDEVQVTTDADGRYEFNDVAAGSYVIVQTQPAAYLNGGPNQINVQLASGQTLGDRNFRELGLRPEYIYNRLFTTLALPPGSSGWVATLTRINADAEAAEASASALSAVVAAPESSSSVADATMTAAAMTEGEPEDDVPASAAGAYADGGSDTSATDELLTSSTMLVGPHWIAGPLSSPLISPLIVSPTATSAGEGAAATSHSSSNKQDSSARNDARRSAGGAAKTHSSVLRSVDSLFASTKRWTF